jgi:hypothetical protein
MFHHDFIPKCPIPCSSDQILFNGEKCCFVPGGRPSMDMCQFCSDYYDALYGECDRDDRCAFRTFSSSYTLCHSCTYRLKFLWERVILK